MLIGRFNIDGEWYQYGRKQGINFAEKEKLVAPEISLGGNFAYDKNGEFYSTTKIYGYIKKATIPESYLFWLGLFNSNLFWHYIQRTGYVLRGGYFTFKTNYILPFPIPQIIPKDLCGLIEKHVEEILELKKNNTGNATFKKHEDSINLLVYELYGLSGKEISIIENEAL